MMNITDPSRDVELYMFNSIRGREFPKSISPSVTSLSLSDLTNIHYGNNGTSFAVEDRDHRSQMTGKRAPAV